MTASRGEPGSSRATSSSRRWPALMTAVRTAVRRYGGTRVVCSGQQGGPVAVEPATVVPSYRPTVVPSYRPLPPEPVSHCGNRLHRRGKPDPLDRPSRDMLQALQAEGQVRATPGLQHGMDLVHDDGAHGAQHLPAPPGGEHEVSD